MDNEYDGRMIQQRNSMRIDNAYVENVICHANSSGSLLISYSVPEQGGSDSIQTLQLNINSNTAILNGFGQRICLCCIQQGARVNVVFSKRMTKSIPPQANAFLVIVKRAPLPDSLTTIGRITLIDFDNDFLYTEDPNYPHNQTKFLITPRTTFANRWGAPISFDALQPGRLVKVTHANFQTASIPPQTTAFRIQLL